MKQMYPAAFDPLFDIFGDDIIIAGRDHDRDYDTQKKALERYSRDMAGGERYRQEPAAVVFPRRTQQVAALMVWANETGIAVTPRGAGSGLAAGAVPVAGGVVCAFEKMNRILEIDTRNLMVVVEPGVITNVLDGALEPHGLFFAGYPMSEDICFIGGNAAENAGGGRAIKYGTTAAWVVGAQVVTPTGEVLNLGGKRLKDVTGYNLLQLMIGSEGTLGLFTQLTIRVIPRPAYRGIAFAAFHTADEATRCVAALQQVSRPSAIEYIGGETALKTNDALPPKQRILGMPQAAAFLLVEVDGSDAVIIEKEREAVATAVKSEGGTIVLSGTNREIVEAAWALRKQVPWWVKRSAGPHHSVEDVVVPPSEIPQLVIYVNEVRSRGPLEVALFGHAGDGNFHVNPMKPVGMTVPEWEEALAEFLDGLYRKVVALGGTISGEHGIGRKRAHSLSIALSPAELDALRVIKNGLDPKGVLNPGVVLPW